MNPQQLREVTRKLWSNPKTFKPWLISRVFGDGKKYLAISPTFFRPYFYVVRVDSNWKKLGGDATIDLIDEIQNVIDEDFGYCCADYAEHGECQCDRWEALPAIDEWGGSHWWEVKAAEQVELGLPPIAEGEAK